MKRVASPPSSDLTPNPFPTREGAVDSPFQFGKGPGVRSPIFGQKVDPVKMARAKELRRDMTEAERILWRALRTNQLHGFHFRRQQVIDGFIADFYCYAAGLVVEFDGTSHQGRAEYDAERETVLTACGHACYPLYLYFNPKSWSPPPTQVYLYSVWKQGHRGQNYGNNG